MDAWTEEQPIRDLIDMPIEPQAPTMLRRGILSEHSTSQANGGTSSRAREVEGVSPNIP